MAVNFNVNLNLPTTDLGQEPNQSNFPSTATNQADLQTMSALLELVSPFATDSTANVPFASELADLQSQRSAGAAGDLHKMVDDNGTKKMLVLRQSGQTELIDPKRQYKAKNDKEAVQIDRALQGLKEKQAVNPGHAITKTIKTGKRTSIKVTLRRDGSTKVQHLKIKRKGLFGKIFGGVRKIFGGIGRNLFKALPLLSTAAMFIPGLQPLGLVGKIATGATNLIKGIKSGNILGGVLGAAGSFLGGAVGKTSGFLGKVGSLFSGILGKIGGSGFGGILSKVTGLFGGNGGVLGKIGGLFNGGGGLSGLLGRAADIFGQNSILGKGLNLFNNISNVFSGRGSLLSRATGLLNSFSGVARGGFANTITKGLSFWNGISSLFLNNSGKGVGGVLNFVKNIFAGTR